MRIFSLAFIVLSLTSTANVAQAETTFLSLPTNEIIYCSDRNVYDVISKRIELYLAKSPECAVRISGSSDSNGGLYLTIGSGSYGCGYQYVRISAFAGCSF